MYKTPLVHYIIFKEYHLQMLEFYYKLVHHLPIIVFQNQIQAQEFGGYLTTEQATETDSSYSIWGWNGSKVYNSIIECNWNNVGGNGIQGISGFITNTIVNCVFRLANATAPYLNNGGTAQAIAMRGNTYQGGAAFNVNLTQSIVAVQDTQGNIYL